MAKRKQRKLAADPPDGVSSDTSVELLFPGFELFTDDYHAHPIWKTIDVATVKGCLTQVSSSSQFPRGQRSKGRIRKETMAVVQDNGSHEERTVEDSISECYFATHPRKPRSMRSKRKTEPIACEVVREASILHVRKSKRLHHSTKHIGKWGKLDSGKFESYMETIWRRFGLEKRNTFTYLDSLWFSSYTREPLKAKALSWVKKKDIFSKKYVFVPIVHWGHWFLLIFCHFGESAHSENKSRCFLLLDSLQKANSKQLEPGIRRFVFDIFKIEERPEKKEIINKIPLLIPKVPQQKKGDECGFYVLYYINLFLESAPDNSCFSMGYPHFMKEDWFTPEEVECFMKGLDSMDKSSDFSG